MAQQLTQIEGGFGHSLFNALGTLRGIFGSIGTAMIQARSRSIGMQVYRELNAKSDEELAALNIKREDIAQQVFHHLY